MTLPELIGTNLKEIASFILHLISLPYNTKRTFKLLNHNFEVTKIKVVDAEVEETTKE